MYPQCVNVPPWSCVVYFVHIATKPPFGDGLLSGILRTVVFVRVCVCCFVPRVSYGLVFAIICFACLAVRFRLSLRFQRVSLFALSPRVSYGLVFAILFVLLLSRLFVSGSRYIVFEGFRGRPLVGQLGARGDRQHGQEDVRAAVPPGGGWRRFRRPNCCCRVWCRWGSLEVA